MFAAAKTPRSGRKSRSLNLRPAFETLQRRELMAGDVVASVQPAIEISDGEQLIIELINRARSNPAAEAARFGIDLNAGLSGSSLITTAPKSPVAPDSALQVAAALHSTDMLMRDYFAHDALQPAPHGLTPSDRAGSAGYAAGAGENLALWPVSGTSVEADVLGSHKLLFESPGHRSNILLESYNDIGIGIETGEYSGAFYAGATHNTQLTTELFGIGNTGRPALTGVVFQDTHTSDNFYSMGEGVEGVTITAVKSTGETYVTTTGISGGYTLRVPAGSYQVIAFQGAFLSQSVEMIEVSSKNVKMDFRTDVAGTALKRDVNSDGQITPLDALLVINLLNADPAQLNLALFPAHLDVDQNGLIQALDALHIINEINRVASEGEGSESAWVQPMNSELSNQDLNPTLASTSMPAPEPSIDSGDTTKAGRALRHLKGK